MENIYWNNEVAIQNEGGSFVRPVPSDTRNRLNTMIDHHLTRREMIQQSGLVLTASAISFSSIPFAELNLMTDRKTFDVIIIGGSYAGLSAAMALGRAMKKVLVIDSGLPCNRQTPHSHNLITQDGERPEAIAEKAKAQVQNYSTIKFLNEVAVSGKRAGQGFEIITQTDQVLAARKLIFATGLKDIMPDIKGFSECWGISIIHCPYCHGYEVRNQKTGIIANGNVAYHYAQLIFNWTKDLTIFTHGESTLTGDQTDKITRHGIRIIEKEIMGLKHENGWVRQVQFKEGSAFELNAIYSRPDYEQHCKIPESLGCELTEQKLLKTDAFQQTTVNGVYACGDNCTFRSVATAISTGVIAGGSSSNKLIEEHFSES